MAIEQFEMSPYLSFQSVLGCNLLRRLVIPQRFERHSSFELV